MKSRARLIGSAQPTPQLTRTGLVAVACAVRDIIAIRPHGSDGEVMFKAMTVYGCDRAQFDAILIGLTEAGWIERRDHLYYPGIVARQSD